MSLKENGEKKAGESDVLKKGAAAVQKQLAPFKKEMAIIAVLGLVSAAANGAVPYVTGRFFDALIALSKGASEGSMLPLWALFLGLWFGVEFIATNSDWILDRLRRKVDTRMHLSIQVNGFLHLLRLPLLFHKNERVNEILSQISMAGWRVSAIVQNVVDLGPQFLSVVIGITFAATINLTLAGILLAGVVLYSVMLVFLVRPLASIDEQAHRVWNENWGDAAATVLQIESVKQAAAETHESEKIREGLLEKAYDLWYRLERGWNNISFFQRVIVFLTQLTVFIISVGYIRTGILTVGELVALNGYALMFFGPFMMLGRRWQVVQTGLVSGAKMQNMLDMPIEQYTPEGGTDIQVRGNVAFNDVSFEYDDKKRSGVLHDISFTVEAGAVVALVGESGVGKSTTISLLSGYYFPTKGSVMVDGVDTRRINLTSLRSQIAVVPQEVALFNDTIKENIRYGIFDAGDEAVKNAARHAHLDEFIEGLPKQYDTLVGERGMKLSVGQKQRIAIARAILRDPKILILDEPTSALDAKTEKHITGSLEELMRGRTTFIIAHRLSTVRKADTIIVLDKGRIVEQGTHEELLNKKDGVYRHLYEYQIGLHR